MGRGGVVACTDLMHLLQVRIKLAVIADVEAWVDNVSDANLNIMGNYTSSGFRV